MDAIGRVVAVLLCVVLFFFIPLRYKAVSAQTALQLDIQCEMNHFLNQIIQNKELTMTAYEQFLNGPMKVHIPYTIELFGYRVRKNLQKSETIITYDYFNLVEELEKGSVPFKEGDQIVMELTQKETFMQRLQNLLLPVFDDSVFLKAGGVIR